MIWREVSRVYEHGGSWALRVPPKIRQALQLRPTDLILLTVIDDHVLLTRFDAERILPRQEARQLVTTVEKAIPSKAAND